MAPAQVRYIYAWDDYVVLSRVLRRESFWKRHQLVIVPAFLTVCLLAGLVGIASLTGGNVGHELRLVLTSPRFWLFPVMAVGFVWVMNRIELGLWYKRQRIDGSEVSVAFDDPRGLVTSSKDGEGVINWSAIRKIVTESDAHVVLLENRLVGVCMPRRAFSSDEAFRATRAHVEQKMAENRSANP